MTEAGMTEPGTCPFTVDRPIMRQRWERLTFLHWGFDPDAVERLLPTSLILFSEIRLAADAGSVAPAPIERSEPRGHRQRSAKSAALTWSTCLRSLRARLRTISGIWQRQPLSLNPRAIAGKQGDR